MKTQELRAMSQLDIGGKIVELKSELMELNSQIATGTTLKSPSKVKAIKRAIAKMLTINQEKISDKNKKEAAKRNE